MDRHRRDVDLIALARRTDHPALREMAVFDAVINNADRKIGHLLPVADGHLYGCDHGICFAEEYKLRTVLWQWRGEPLPARAVETLRRLSAAWPAAGSPRSWRQYLTRAEIAAAAARVEVLLASRRAPLPARGLARRPLAPVLKPIIPNGFGRLSA